MKYSGAYFDKNKTKFSHKLCQIPNEVTPGGPALGCLGKTRPYVIGSIDSLFHPELYFGFVFDKNHNLLLINLLYHKIFEQPTQRMSYYLDFSPLEDLPIMYFKIDIVSEESLRLAPELFLILLYMNCQVGGLVGVFSAVTVNEKIAGYHANSNFCPELSTGHDLVPDYQTHMWLMDAYYTILASMSPPTKHHLLLIMHINDCLDCPFLYTDERPYVSSSTHMRLNSIRMSR